MKYLFVPVLFVLLLSQHHSTAQSAERNTGAYHLIAHRGGVVDSTRAENSLPALQAAIDRGYRMIEIDLRQTKDGVFVIQHDKTFKRYFGVDKPVSSITWDEISRLRSDHGNSRVLTLEEVLSQCKGKLQVMIDNKVPGNDTLRFRRVVTLLKKYDLLEQALMIGTDESTEYFTGKVKLSCTRQQLEDNRKRPGFRAADYYLFGSADSMTREDVAWAGKEGIMVVGAVNRYAYHRSNDPLADAGRDIALLKSWGVKYFQIDSEFDSIFMNME